MSTVVLNCLCRNVETLEFVFCMCVYEYCGTQLSVSKRWNACVLYVSMGTVVLKIFCLCVVTLEHRINSVVTLEHRTNKV